MTAGLCELIALHRSASGPWSEDKCDPVSVFRNAYADLREAIALGREVQVTDDKGLKDQMAALLTRQGQELKARLANWQPTDRQVEIPQ